MQVSVSFRLMRVYSLGQPRLVLFFVTAQHDCHARLM
jgi:hypothetical protein